MKNTHPYKILAIAIAISTFLRLLQKLFWINPLTGFFITNQSSGYLLMAVMVIGFGFSYYVVHDKNYTIGKGIHCPALGILSVILGGAVAADTLAWVLYPPKELPLVLIPSWVELILLISGIAAALSILLLAKGFFGGQPFGRYAVCTVSIPLWQAVRTITRFGYFKQVTTLSDNLMESCFMMACCLFFMSHAYIVTGLRYEHHSRYTIALGLMVAILGLPLVVGQTGAILLYGTSVSGPSLPSCFLILATSLYALIFVHHLLKIEQEPLPETSDPVTE